MRGQLILAALVGLIAVLLSNTFNHKQATTAQSSSHDYNHAPTSDIIVSRLRTPDIPATIYAERSAAIADRLAASIRFRTISDVNHSDASQFVQLHQFIVSSFPRVHARLTREEVGNRHAVLYTLAGADTTLRPYLLMSHLDVVPVDDFVEDTPKHHDHHHDHHQHAGKCEHAHGVLQEIETQKSAVSSQKKSTWTHPPFAGIVKDGFIWGRGSLDDKMGVLSLLEALELLLEHNPQFIPHRTLLFGFGADEEIGGEEGAKLIKDVLKQRNLLPEFVLDEGGVIGHGLLAGAKKPIALIGLSEKGYASFELSVTADGGHSSMPSVEDAAIPILARAVLKLNDHPRPPVFTPTVEELLVTAAPIMPFAQRVVLSNLWLFKPVVAWLFSKKPSTNAIVRTTTAATMFNAGIADNVLPKIATATVNFRTLPIMSESPEELELFIKHVIGDERVKVTLKKSWNAATNADLSSNLTGVAPSSGSLYYDVLANTIRTVYPDVEVAPFCMVGMTDSRYYHGTVTDNVYRYYPMRVTGEDLKRIHGSDERIAVDNYVESVRFFVELIRNLSEL